MAITDYLTEARTAVERLRGLDGAFTGSATPSLAYVAVAEQLALQNLLTVLADESNLLRITNVQADQLVTRARQLLGFS